MRSRRSLLLLLAGGLIIGVLSGCEQEGPMERAGESADETVEETGEAIERQTD